MRAQGKMLTLIAAGLVLILAQGRPALADDISDRLKKGTELYEQGDLAGALEELELAITQIRQKKGEALEKVFPAAPAGWQAEKAESQAAGPGMFGGGVTATQAYRQTSGEGTAEIQIISDSPLIQTLGMFLANPMFLQGGEQGKLVVIKGQKALLKKTGDDSAELQTLLDNKVLVRVEVSGVKGPDQVAQTFAEAIEFEKIRALNK
ncbi:MAG: hypothetical protein KQJ78_12105 [Deltaproteobacteria bacterium]|nr:hypothetical protein [Deltaproteobacteria bacterium]